MMHSNTYVDHVHLFHYWSVLHKRRNLIFVVACSVVAVTMVVSYAMKPLYRASAKMAIERENVTSPVTGQRTEPIDIRTQQLTSNTHLKLIASRPVLEYMLKQYADTVEEPGGKIDDPPVNPVQKAIVFLQGWVKMLKNTVGLTQQKKSELSEAELLEQRVAQLQDRIQVTPERDTRLLDLEVEDDDPIMAARIANQLAKSYIEFDLAGRLASDKQNLDWLNREVSSLKQRLEGDELKFYEYKQQNRVFSLEEKQKVTSQKIYDLNNEYNTIKSKRQELDAKLEEIKKKYSSGGDISYVRSILDNKVINDIYASLTGLELELSRLSKVFKSKHPKIQQIHSEIAKVSSKFEAELDKEIENLKVQQSILLNREREIQSALSEDEEEVLETSSKELQYTILKRNMETSQQLYDTLVTKIKESGIASTGTISNIRIAERATVPGSPLMPDKKKYFLVSLVLGVFGGIGLAFLLEYLDLTIRSEEDVRNYLDLPVLAVIPMAEKSEREVKYLC